MLSTDGTRKGQVLVVTSTAPREGKTLVAANLAATLAAADQRVALLDADLRRPRLHTIFNRQREPGVSDVLSGKRTKAEALRPVVGLRGLSLITSGAPTPNASEMLSLSVFKEFVESIRAEFDWIVIDSSPVMAVTDAAVLAHDASAVLFVTTAEHTRMEAAETALAELNAAGARLIGAVLNRAPLTREAYYYGRYYRSEYADYYTSSASEPSMGAGEKPRRPAASPTAAASGRVSVAKSARGSP
jgi:receptor protein-tyrosine kinase